MPESTVGLTSRRSITHWLQCWNWGSCKKGTKQKAQVFDVDKLKQPEIKAAFNLEVHNRSDVLDSVDSVDETWSNFKTTVAQVADSVVGYRRGTRKERWVSDSTWKAIDERKRIKQQKSQGQITTEQTDDLEKKYRMKYREVKKQRVVVGLWFRSWWGWRSSTQRIPQDTVQDRQRAYRPTNAESANKYGRWQYISSLCSTGQNPQWRMIGTAPLLAHNYHIYPISEAEVGWDWQLSNWRTERQPG